MKKTSCLNQETKSWGIPKFTSLISLINRGDFLQLGDFFGLIKMTPHGKQDFMKKKRLHKISL